MAWTKRRLAQVARSRLNSAKLIVVSNREPYIHRYRHGEVELIHPAAGLTTALDPVMQACGGVWVAHGSGDADRVSCDTESRVHVPPQDPRYVLRRVWLSNEEENGYYYGFANSTIWPLCHQVYQRPTFDPADLRHYRIANERFADAVLDEASGGPAFVFVQDYHFALLPQLLKQRRPDLVVAQFWHIPWPHAETFRVCPWAVELLEGMLASDLLAFQVQYHCNNFLETVDRMIEARICREQFAVNRNGQITRVRPFPISIDPDLARDYLGDDWQSRAKLFRRKFRLGDRPLLVGVDRLDYTKGIPERLWAIDRLLDAHPELAGKFHFVQIGAPSRTNLLAYNELNCTVQDLVDAINFKHGTETWTPIVFDREHCNPREVFTWYRMAAGCVVSSLHDGMNLVAKEFVATRDDEQGVLILSSFTGAARELASAVLVNPFDLDRMAEALHTALTMPADEQQQRMKRMRAQVRDNNIYRWAGMLLSEALKIHDATPSSPINGRNGHDAESVLTIDRSMIGSLGSAIDSAASLRFTG